MGNNGQVWNPGEDREKLVRVFYDDFKCAVEDQGKTREWFDIKTGVKQGCNMPGFLFLIIMDWAMWS